MKRTIEITTCDICHEDKLCDNINYPVLFDTDQTEGNVVPRYISQTKIDVCKDCQKNILKLTGVGAQGHNTYTVKE